MHITEWEFYNSVGGLSFPIAVGHNPRCERERQGKKISHLWTLYVAVLRIRIFFDRIQIRTCIHKHIIERSQSITFSRLYTTFSLIYKNMFKRKQWLMFVFFSEFKNAQNLIIPMEVVNVEAEKIFRVSFDWTKKMPRDNSNLVICNVWKWHFMYLCWLWWKKIIQTKKIVRKCNNKYNRGRRYLPDLCQLSSD